MYYNYSTLIINTLYYRRRTTSTRPDYSQTISADWLDGGNFLELDIWKVDFTFYLFFEIERGSNIPLSHSRIPIYYIYGDIIPPVSNSYTPPTLEKVSIVENSKHVNWGGAPVSWWSWYSTFGFSQKKIFFFFRKVILLWLRRPLDRRPPIYECVQLDCSDTMSIICFFCFFVGGGVRYRSACI